MKKKLLLVGTHAEKEQALEDLGLAGMPRGTIGIDKYSYGNFEIYNTRLAVGIDEITEDDFRNGDGFLDAGHINTEGRFFPNKELYTVAELRGIIVANSPSSGQAGVAEPSLLLQDSGITNPASPASGCHF